MSHLPKRRIRGFTLVELVTLTAIAVLILATSLPAVQQAREDARLTTCRNNLKQLGLAMHNYHDTYRCFPPAWTSRRWEGAGHPSTGWQTSVLPYVDEIPLFNQLNVSDPVYETENSSLLNRPVSAYLCPVDVTGETNSLRGGWGTSNYSMNYGSHPIPRWSNGFTQQFWPGQTVSLRRGIAERDSAPNGVGEINRGARIADMIDGTSNTLMIGERSAISGAGIWPGPRSNFHENDVATDASYASPLNRSLSGFASHHSGIVNFTFGDGAVHSIAENIDSQPEWGVLQKLAARNDGMVVDF